MLLRRKLNAKYALFCWHALGSVFAQREEDKEIYELGILLKDKALAWSNTPEGKAALEREIERRQARAKRRYKQQKRELARVKNMLIKARKSGMKLMKDHKA